MDIRIPAESDLDPLLEFFARVPEGERTFFKEAVLDRATVQGWLVGDRGRRAVVVEPDGQVAGYVAVVPLAGWGSRPRDCCATTSATTPARCATWCCWRIRSTTSGRR